MLGRRRDPDQRHHLLRRQPGDGCHPAHRPARSDVDLGANGALPLHDMACDDLGDLLHDPGLAEHDVADRLVEYLREARHVNALLAAAEVDGALDLGGHHRLGVATANPDRLLDAGDAGAGKRQLDGRRRCLHVGDEMWQLGHRT